jgi:hypothetical protein
MWHGSVSHSFFSVDELDEGVEDEGVEEDDVEAGVVEASDSFLPSAGFSPFFSVPLARGGAPEGERLSVA